MVETEGKQRAFSIAAAVLVGRVKNDVAPKYC